jgi:hypothetical protein
VLWSFLVVGYLSIDKQGLHQPLKAQKTSLTVRPWRCRNRIFLLVATKPWNVDLEPGKALRIHDFVVIYEWCSDQSRASHPVGLSARWWLKPSRSPAAEWLPEQRTPRWFWPLAIAAMVLTAFWGIQRISQSLWDDEGSSLNRAVLGQYRPDKGGEPKLRETTWEIARFSVKFYL